MYDMGPLWLFFGIAMRLLRFENSGCCVWCGQDVMHSVWPQFRHAHQHIISLHGTGLNVALMDEHSLCSSDNSPDWGRLWDTQYSHLSVMNLFGSVLSSVIGVSSSHVCGSSLDPPPPPTSVLNCCCVHPTDLWWFLWVWRFSPFHFALEKKVFVQTFCPQKWFLCCAFAHKEILFLLSFNL